MTKRSAIILFILFLMLGGSSAIAFFFTKTSNAQLLFISLAVIFIIAAIASLLWYALRNAAKIRKSLRLIDSLFSTGSIDELKQAYVKIYDEYLKLSEKEKRNFYAKIARIREKVEDLLHQSKKIEELFKEAEVNDPLEKKKKIDTLSEMHQKLPFKEQGKYQQRLTLLKEKLN